MSNLFLTNPLSLTRETDIDMPLLTDKMYYYLANNFFQPLNCTEINAENIHHFFDAVLSFRACFFNLKFYELVDEMNILLDVLVNYIDEVPGFSKYKYREEYYREPKKHLQEKTKNTSNGVQENISSNMLNSFNKNAFMQKIEEKSVDTKLSKKLKANETNKPKTNKKGYDTIDNSKFSNLSFIKKDILEMLKK